MQQNCHEDLQEKKPCRRIFFLALRDPQHLSYHQIPERVPHIWGDGGACGKVPSSPKGKSFKTSPTLQGNICSPYSLV